MTPFIFFVVVILLIYFQSKISNLEKRLTDLEGKGQNTKSAKPAAKPFLPEDQSTSMTSRSPYPAQPTAQEPFKDSAGPKPAVATASKQASAPAKSKFSEEQIGKEWFNKIGALSIIIGLVLFVGYTFQYLGPLGKIAIGYVCSALVVGLGIFLLKKYQRYAQVLVAVGWAGIYFTTFAMHHIEASMVMESAVWNLILLFAVSFGLAAFAYWQDSEEFSILAVFLGSLSAIISDVPFYSLIGILALVLYAMPLAVLRNWATFGFFVAASSYLTYWLALIRQGAFYEFETFAIGSFFLVIYFIIFAVVSFFIRSGKYDKNTYHASLIIFNTFAFFVLFMSQMAQFYPERDGLVSGVFGLVLLLLSLIGFGLIKQERVIYISYAWLGWGFLTLAVPLQLVGMWITLIWLVEGALLLILGLIYNKKHLMLSGGLTLLGFILIFLGIDLFKKDMTAVLGVEIAIRTILGSFAALVFAVIYVVWEVVKKNLEEKIQQLVAIPLVTSVIFVMLMIFLESSRDLLTIYWLSVGVVVYLIGFFLNKSYVRFLGALSMVFPGISYFTYDIFQSAIIFGEVTYRMFNSVLIAIVLYILYAISFVKNSILAEEDKNIRDVFCVIASAILVILMALEVSSRLVTVSWSVEGLILLIIGFSVNQRVLRLTGMAILLLAVLRLFLIDLSFLETLYRILSFIVLGVILLGVSFVYNKYKDKIL